MKSRRPARRTRSILFRIAGYAGTTALVAAAAVVLLMPLLDEGEAGGAGAQGSASPASTAPGGQAGIPGGSGLPGSPTGPAPQGSGRPEPGVQPGGQGGGGQGGGPQIPDQSGAGSITWCPRGAASYRATRTGVDVVISVSSSGAVRAELVLRGRAPESQQTTVSGGRPHTFHFRGASPRLVERVKITTVSVGVSMQTCYARAAA